MAAAQPSLREELNINKPAKKPKSMLFAANDSDTDGVGFNMAVRHDESANRRKTNFQSPVKALQVFPLNAVDGALTFNF